MRDGVEGMADSRCARVAIVIPCFNDGEALLDAVDSALRQRVCELLVVDDGSTDASTAAHLNEIAASGIRVIRQANRGSAAARMAGVAASSAPYIQPLDADDRLVEGISEKMMKYLDGHPEVSAVWGDVQLAGDFTHTRRTAPTLDPWLLTFVNDVPGPGSMIRREALMQVGGWSAPDPSRPSCYWDWNLWMSFAERGYVGAHIGTVALQYRMRGGSMNGRCSSAHGELYAQLRACHETLFAARAYNRGRSVVPPAARLAIRVIEVVPRLSRRSRGRLQHAVCKLAFRRGGYVRTVRRGIQLGQASVVRAARRGRLRGGTT